MPILDRLLRGGLRTVRRFVVTVVGATILLGGLMLLVLPGPAFVVIPIGLAVLALEFEWARRLLRRAHDVWKDSGPRKGPADVGPGTGAPKD